MEWALLNSLPGQLGALGAVLAFVGILLRLVFTGRLVPSTLVPRTTLDDVRADRDARLAEANADAEQWRDLYIGECRAHETTRQAYAEEIRAALLASTEGAQIAAALLTEIRKRQIEADL